ncbi:PIG-L family deacetylase [Caballeronia sp.]|uniref:PIG-L family deacetylase n=1 Tax=Caballeronia sp. TaxID=1931223 RepID=UPI003C619061
MSDIFARPLVMSPHFNDAVFSCGAMLAAHPGTVVYTVCSGCPAADVTTEWDLRCSFDNATHATQARSLEDDRALDILTAVPERGDFLDAQYVPFVPLAHAPTQEAIAQALDHALRRHGARTLVIPFGLVHPDHELVRRAAKRRAVKAYASQLKAFGPDGYDDVFCTERCWKLVFAPKETSRALRDQDGKTRNAAFGIRKN